MSARSKARKRAIDLLYSAELRGLGLDAALATETTRAMNEPARQASWVYAREIVEGVASHFGEIDELIETYAEGWTLSRMPALDRAILRMGIWEILFNDDIPNGVAIAEAVDQARELSTDDSGKFVNGLLAKIAQSEG